MERNERIADLERKVEELTVFHEIGKTLTSTLDLNRVLETVMEQISKLFQPTTWSLLLIDPKTNELYFEIAVGQAAEALRNVRLKVGEGVAGWVAEHGKAIFVSDAEADTRFTPRVDQVTQMATQTIAAVPVRGTEQVLGVIELVNITQGNQFGEREMFLLQALADYAAIALQNARHVQRIHEMTITDDCTGLFNARHLQEAVETEIYRSMRYGYEFSLIFIDLDRFKSVNDTHGHLVGSRLLGEVGRLIKENLRMIDTAFRYGGDEFVVLLPQTGKQSATTVARRIHRLLANAVFLEEEGLSISLTASFGLASFPQDARTKEELIHLADEAMYAVKNTSRNSIALANQGVLDTGSPGSKKQSNQG